jgi:hypothetical protein
MRFGIALALVILVALLVPLPAWAASYQILPVSQQRGPSRASVGASVEVSSRSPGNGGASSSAPVAGSEASSGPAPPAMPTLPSNSPKLTNPRPYGPNSFWYPTVEGQRCAYVPASNGICFNIVQAEEPAAAPPPVNPAALAEAAANRVALAPGRIQASPSTHTAGLTGTPSWFWLSPAPPSTRTVSVAARGEHVTVTASASTVRWAFGDGSSLAGGAGVPYQPGSVPSDAILHSYETRCLAGDQGHDPNVLASCGPEGYTVAATVEWGVSFIAHGPITSSGTLATRSTATSLTYPVSEARAFLSSAGGGK